MLETKEDLITARKKIGFSQQKLAELSGVSVPTIAKIEQGQRLGSEQTWKKINNVFNNIHEISQFESENQSKLNKEWLIKSREKHGLSQAQLAQKIGVHIRTINHIEQGQRLGSEQTWKKIKKFFENLDSKKETKIGE